MNRYIGQMLDDRYEILEVIGSGGMSVVYKAMCHKLHRYVAVKILRDEMAEDAELKNRFQAEAHAVAMLSQPNIVAVYDVGHSGDTEYIVMELIEGVTLKQRLAEFSPGTNVITGENAQGKTNLLEAVYLLTGGKSFRTRFDRELIGFGYTSAEVLADVYAFGREQTVRVVLRQGQRKQIWQNGVKKTAAELAGNFAAVLFCPDDLNIIRDGPAARRRMMDMAISQLR